MFLGFFVSSFENYGPMYCGVLALVNMGEYVYFFPGNLQRLCGCIFGYRLVKEMLARKAFLCELDRRWGSFCRLCVVIGFFLRGLRYLCRRSSFLRKGIQEGCYWAGKA